MMKILILGAGQVGASLARYLSKDTENEITIVDKDATNLATAPQKYF
jgi:trk system potassium uptake protein TrkA